MQYLLGFVYNSSPNAKKKVLPPSSSPYTAEFSSIGAGGRQQDIELPSRVLCEKGNHHLSAAHPHEDFPLDKACSPRWALLSAQKTSPWL